MPRVSLSASLKLLPLLLLFLLASCGTVGHNIAGIDNFDQVSPDLFRGAQPDQKGFQTLAAMHVKTVINLRDGNDTREAAEVREAGMTYIHIPLDAETVTPADADRVLKVIAAADGPVFVHCLVGRDRTGMACAAYRITVQGWNQQDAIRDLYAHGHFWLFYPKVRQALAHLAQPSATPVAAATPGPIAPIQN